MNKLFAFWNMLSASKEKTDDHIFIKIIRQVEEIQLHNVIVMSLCTDCSSNPQMIVIDETKKGTTTYHFPLYEGFQIHTCNEFLRSLDTDINIEFVTYRQYADLIKKCFNSIKQ